MIEYNKKNARMWAMMGINPAIWSIGYAEVTKERNDTVVFTADLQRYSGLQRTFQANPCKCFNVGIAEQNMVAIASGMAMEGKQAWMTTYAPFMSFRCADHVRHLMGNLNLNMKAIGSAAGFSAGFSGASLLAVSDIAFMRSIPNMVVLSPADTMEAVKMTIAISKTDAPCYMRFCGAVNLPMVYTEDYEFEIGKAVEMTKGEKVAILATGPNMVAESIKAGKAITETKGITPTVANVHTIKPLDAAYIDSLLDSHSLIVTVEEHSVIGGLGSAVAEYVSSKKWDGTILRLGIEDKIYTMGARDFMLEQAGLTASNISKRIIESIY